jgi:hypothetical protein
MEKRIGKAGPVSPICTNVDYTARRETTRLNVFEKTLDTGDWTSNTSGARAWCASHLHLLMDSLFARSGNLCCTASLILAIAQSKNHLGLVLLASAFLSPWALHGGGLSFGGFLVEHRSHP